MKTARSPCVLSHSFNLEPGTMEPRDDDPEKSVPPVLHLACNRGKAPIMIMLSINHRIFGYILGMAVIPKIFIM